ncbi:hypothetical protein ACFSTE_11810 [Aquimarina hainanensis]|uniref:Lipocalin-like domain-containing protein n=1 Tax=Aquimarina hainanensis TaxID=1578017 RepID=A0ABW5NAD2_9FLAO|nr:hypothetical protein [Aquimarina sp. TRL1]QKX05282.1 hypothetical protein HN014_10240 [Aquimarina sp. TRL1]
MKKTIFFLLIIPFLAFTSCSSDDDNATDNESLLTGKWRLTAFSVTNGKSITTAQGATLTTDFTSEGKDFSTEVIFTKIPKIAASTGKYTAVTTTTVEGQTSTTDVTGVNFDLVGLWEIQGNKLIVEDPNSHEKQSTTITELTSTKLSFTIDYKDTVNNAGVTTEASGTANYTFTKK